MSWVRTGPMAFGWVMALVWAKTAVSAEERVMCVYDPSGMLGDAWRTSVSYQAAASGRQAFRLTVYRDEGEIVRDLEGGTCDGAVLTGVAAARLLPSAYTVEAIGAIGDYGHLRRVAAALVEDPTPLIGQQWEGAGFLPAGGVYVHVRDRGRGTVAGLAGARVCALDDPAAKALIMAVGAAPVITDIAGLSRSFKDGACDATYAPAAAWGPLELHRGVGVDGGVVSHPIAQFTFPILLRRGRFSDDFATWTREWTLTQFPSMIGMITRDERAIPGSTWIPISSEERVTVEALFQRLRDDLQAVGRYDAAVLEVIRDQADP